MRKVLFVCLGNTCRSPIAEAVFEHLIKLKNLENSWDCDSAALRDWHEGDPANVRARQVLRKHGIPINSIARTIRPKDYERFDFVLGMDEYNVTMLRTEAPRGSKAEIMLLGAFDPEGERIIRDPYCDDSIEGFEKCFEQCMRSCEGFLSHYE